MFGFDNNFFVLCAVSTSLLVSGCDEDIVDSAEVKPHQKMSCRQAIEYVGVKIYDFPQDRFSKIRTIRVGTPTTMDYVKDRATVVYNDEGYVVSASCG